METTYFLVYKTINQINNKCYIGAHVTKNKNDTYLGSGVALKRAIQKYGKSSFIRIILFECETLDEMYDKERQCILENLGPTCYNMHLGGQGGWDYINRSGMMRGDGNHMRSPEMRAKFSEIMKKRKGVEKYRTTAIKNLEKAKLANYGRKKSEKEIADFVSRTHDYWTEKREIVRNNMSGMYEVQDPNGCKYQTNRLKDFCQTHGLAYVTMVGLAKTLRTPIKGRCKGWTCREV